MSEEGNIGYFCDSECAKKAGLRDTYMKIPLEKFAGKHVKVGFPIVGRKGKEFMWVKVGEIKEETLVGVLDNDPQYDCGVQCGDTVEITKDEIVLVLAESGEFEYEKDLDVKKH